MSPARKTLPPLFLIVMWTMALFVAGMLATVAQQAQDEDATRHLWDTAYIKQGAKRASARRPAKRSYRIATPQVPVTGVQADSVIGITLWRLRPSRSDDSGERIITHDDPESAEWIPERVSSDGAMSEGDRVRISIEAARTGYLYVVDQEQYADGTKGEPYRTRNGDNAVSAGRIIEIPAQDDSPPFFTLKRTRANHVGESLIVLVSPTPIEGLTITDKAQVLSDETLAALEKSWGAQTGRLEMENGSGKAWTRQEKEAGADSTRALQENEPAPQTIYYRPGANATTPVLVKVQLKYSKTEGKRRR
jgi:hypothetical protein